MTTVLVVDDSAVDRRRAGQLLENGTGWSAVYADNGRAALTLMEQTRPDLVLTDLQMPEMDGLVLVQEIKKRFPLVPVILMTAYGSEDIAIQALQQGAASYVPKRNLAQDLADTVRDILEVAKADRDHVQTLLQYTKIPAPFDGVVTRRNVNTRDFVQPAGTSKGESLFVVERVDPVRVFINVQELEAVWVRDGDTALVRPQSLQGQQFKGTVTRTSGALNPQNRTLRTEIDLPNKEGKLLPGMFVKATIIAEHKNVWALPVAAVVTQDEQTFCYRVEGGKAVRTPLQVGLRGNELVEVLKKQMKPAKGAEQSGWEDISGQEVIVASAAASLTDGQAVSLSSGDK